MQCFFPIEKQISLIGNHANKIKIEKKMIIIHSVLKRLTVIVAFTFLCGPIKTN